VGVEALKRLPGSWQPARTCSRRWHRAGKAGLEFALKKAMQD
jgi:hypothetical protein